MAFSLAVRSVSWVEVGEEFTVRAGRWLDNVLMQRDLESDR
jgi:hypothetical protein